MSESKKVPRHPDSPCLTCPVGELVCSGTSHGGCQGWKDWFHSEWRKTQDALKREKPEEGKRHHKSAETQTSEPVQKSSSRGG